MDKTQSILIVSNLFPPDVIGGYELGCSRIAANLASDGFDVTVATSMERAFTGDSGDYVTPEGVKVRRLFPPIMDYANRTHLEVRAGYRVAKSLRTSTVDQSNAISLKRLIDANKFDVAYVFNFIGLGPISILETLLTMGKAVIVHLMDNLDMPIKCGVKSSGVLARIASIKSRIHAISCSQQTLRRNSQIGHYGSNRIIYSGIEMLPGTFERFQGKEGAFNLVYTGQATAWKGMPQLLRAYHLLLQRRRDLNVKLHLIGGSPDGYLDIIRKTKQSLIDEGKLIIHGMMQYHDLFELLRGMDLGVYPLHETEAFGYAPIECLECGVPAIITRGTGASEMLPVEYPLFLNDRDDVNELAGLMESATTMPSLRESSMSSYHTIRFQYLFSEHTYPGIKNLLGSARPIHPPTQFGEILLFAKTYSDYAFAFPHRIL